MTPAQRLSGAARVYAERLRWAVIPLHDVSAGVCSCPKGAACPSAGKHPRVQGWQLSATSNTEKIAAHWGRWPHANPGIATGALSGFFVLDVDPDKGGRETLAALEAQHGRLPATVQQQTGSTGDHYAFRLPDFAITNSAGRLGDGLDVRGEGGQIVVAPAVSAKGPYRWVPGRAPWEIEIATAPEWLLDLLRARPALRVVRPEESFPPASPDVIDLARAFLERHGPAVEGQGGDEHTFIACAFLRKNLALTEEEAWPLVVEWNVGCQPPWSDDDLAAKLRGGAKYGDADLGCDRPFDIIGFAKAQIAKWPRTDESIPALLAPICDQMRTKGVGVHQRAVVERLLHGETGWTPRRLNLPKAIDPKALAEQRQRLERFRNGDPELIDPRAPHTTAKQFLSSTADAEGMPDVRRWEGDYWHAEGTNYSRRPEEIVRADLYTYTDGKRDALSGAPIKPDRALVETTEHALRAAALIHVDRTPAWLGDADYPADEIVPFVNGLLHVATRTFIPATRRFFGLNAVGFPYDPNAPRPARWLAFLEELWPGDAQSKATLQEFFGLVLTPDTSHQKIFLLIGPKRSGKGTIARVLQNLVGESNVTAPTISSLGQHFGLEPLIGKTLAIMPDARISARTDLGVVVENLLRISGEDMQSVPRKHRENFNAKLSTRFLMISNELPAFTDQSGALASRFIILRLTQSFFGREDRALTQRLLPELPGIANWALEGLDRLRRRGHFCQPAASRDMLQQLEDLVSPIKAFLAECCEVVPGASVECGALYDTWRAWTMGQGRERVTTIQVFGRDLSAAVPGVTISRPRVNGRQERHYSGIRLSAETR